MATVISDKHVREKLINQGAETLNDGELLSIILRKGDTVRSAVETANGILEHFKGNLSEISRSDIAQLRMCCGIGISQAAVVAAAMELCRRFKIAEGEEKNTIRCDRDIIEIFQPLLAELPHEECWAIFLNVSGRIIDRIKVSQGGTKGTVVDYKLIVKRGVEKLASGAVIVHNHPSGNHTPSAEDNELTEKLAKAFSLFDILLLDHMIITRTKCYSFREHGFFNSLKLQ